LNEIDLFRSVPRTSAMKEGTHTRTTRRAPLLLIMGGGTLWANSHTLTHELCTWIRLPSRGAHTQPT